MASIPLPALHVQTPEQQGPLDQYGKILQLKNMLNQGQLQEQGLKSGDLQLQAQQRANKDRQAIMEAQAATGGDPNQWLPSLKGKISPETYNELVQQDAKTRKELADASSSERAAKQAANNQLMGVIAQAKGMSPEQYQQQFPQILDAVEKINPGTIQKFKLNPQQPIPQQSLDSIALGLQTADQYFKQADEESKAAKRPFEQKKAESDAASAAVDTQLKEQDLARGGKTDLDKYIFDYLKANKLENTPENRQKAFDVYTKKTKIEPGVARANIFLNRPTEVADPDNPGETIMVPGSQTAGMKGKGSASVGTIKAEQKYMTSGKGSQQLTAFNTAMNHLDTLDRLAAGLNNSNIQLFNKAAQSWAEQTGNPAPANFAAAKNAMSGEVASALKASGATDQEISKVSETFSRAQSPAQLKGAINTYRDLLKGKRDQLKKQYDSGMSAKPNFGDQPQEQNGNSLDKFWKH